jgi:hypothetical protein
MTGTPLRDHRALRLNGDELSDEISPEFGGSDAV